MRTVVVFSGGIDSACTASCMNADDGIYGITFRYGQRASREVDAAVNLGRMLGLEQHRIVDISFMKELYHGTNLLTDSDGAIPERFEYSIVVPIRNAVFLSIATAWAYSISAERVVYGAHTGDGANYPDCRPSFADKLEDALYEGELDGIRAGLRKRIKFWSPAHDGMSKSDLLRRGYDRLGDAIFESWSCYQDSSAHCGKCESCRNRRRAIASAGIPDGTVYEE